MNLTYEKCGDYLIPNIITDSEPEGELRKFGLMRKRYLKEYKSGIYQGMVLNGNLKEHLLMMQEQTELQFDVLVEQMAEGGGVTEQLKGVNQMLWVQRMNNIRARAEEVVREWIFAFRCHLFVWMGLEIDITNRLVKKQQEEIILTFTEFEILLLLAQNAGIVFSKEQIYDSVWKEPYFGDYNIVMSHIRNIREKIEDNPSKPIYIQTVWGVGYRFNQKMV